MFGFQIAKWFWCLWDHLLAIILLNLLSLTLIAGFFYLLFPALLVGQDSTANHIAGSSVASFVIFVVILLVCSFLLTTLQHAYALVNYSMARFERSAFKESLCRAWQKDSLRAALLLDVLLLLLGFIYYVSWHFYSQQGGLLSWLAMGLLFWLGVFFLLSFGYYFPMLVREAFCLKEALRRSFVVCLDNPLLSIALGLVALVLGAASLIPPLMLFGGAVGWGLWYEVALRILYYKYQYIGQLQQENAAKLSQVGNHRNKIDIPWRVLLHEERQRIGPRSLRNFIFPWKD